MNTTSTHGPYPLTLEGIQKAKRAVCPIQFQRDASLHRVAVARYGKVVTYAQLNDQVQRIAAEMTSGSPNGHPIALYRADQLDTVAWIFAALRAGGSTLLVSDRIPAAEVPSIVEASDSRLLVSHEENLSGMTGHSIHSNKIDWEKENGIEGLYAGEAFPLAVEDLSLDSPATLLFTSGTSGSPQVAVLSVRNHLSSAISSNRRIPVTPSSRWLLSLPLFHVGGIAILYRAFVAGASVLLRDPRHSLGQAILEGRPSHISVVSTQLRRILDELPSAPEGLETVLVGGGPIDAELIGKAVKAGYPIRTTYGMTEFSSQIATSAVWNAVREGYSTGRPIDRTEVKLGPGGEILARGPTRFLGYRSLGGSLRKVDASEWFATGDLGRFDKGELVIVGRKDELFISGGENIQPEEIEARLRGIPGIQEAIVVPVPDSEFGFRPVAAVKWNAKPWSEQAVQEKLRLRLPTFKIPVSILPWPDSSSKSSDDSTLKMSRNDIKKAVMNYWNDRDRCKGPLGF